MNKEALTTSLSVVILAANKEGTIMEAEDLVEKEYSTL